MKHNLILNQTSRRKALGMLSAAGIVAIFPGAVLADAAAVAEKIKDAMESGTWLLLKNCHLGATWLGNGLKT